MTARIESPATPGRRRPWGDRRDRFGPARRASAATAVLMALRHPPEVMLTLALRRLGRGRPDVFDRLGAVCEAEILVAPDDFPVAFRLRPDGGAGWVQVVRPDDPSPCAARIAGPLLILVSLFDGGADADAAFFSRVIRITGDTAAVVALHNTLEAAELSLAEMLGVPRPLRAAAGALAASGLSMLRRGERR